MDRKQNVDRLQFHNQLMFYQYIHTIAVLNLKLLLIKWNGHFLLYSQFLLLQLPCKALSIRRLRQSRPQQTMNLDRSTDHHAADPIQIFDRVWH